MHRTRISFLGELAIDATDHASDLKMQQLLLLASLAVTTSGVTRQELIARIWPDGQGDSTKLNNCVSDARPFLCSPNALFADRSARAVRLIREGEDKASREPFVVETDLDEFRQHLASNSDDGLHRALALVRGRFLHGTSHAWLNDERKRFDRLIVRAIRGLTHWPHERATAALEDFYAQPSGTLDGYISALRVDETSDPAELADPQAAILAGLQALYPNGAKIDTLRDLILPQRPVYRDMTVRFHLWDGDAPEVYTLKYQIEYFAATDEFVVALTTRATLGDLLIAECPRISDAFAFSDDAAREAFAGSGIQLVHYDLLADGRTARGKCEFRLVPARQRKRYLGDITPELVSDVVLYAAQVPGTPNQERHLELTITSERMSRSEHYCFWIADRPSYVRRITIDFSRLSLADHPRLHPFLGAVSHEITASDGAYDIMLENWLVKDQGVMLIW
jgi:hypothetical protein